MTGQRRKKRRVIDWERIKFEYSTGVDIKTLVDKFKIDRSTIYKRIANEGWKRCLTEEVNARADLISTGVSTNDDPKKKEEAINDMARRVAAVKLKYRVAWEDHIYQTQEARDAENFDRLKCLKIAAETMSIAQKGEYKAWGIKDPENEEKTAQASAVAVNLDLSDMTADELAKMARAAFRGESNQQ